MVTLCAWCKAPFEPRRISGHDPARYCSDRCRQEVRYVARWTGPKVEPEQPRVRDGQTRHNDEPEYRTWRVICVMCSADWWLRGPKDALNGFSSVSRCPCGGWRTIEEVALGSRSAQAGRLLRTHRWNEAA